MIKSVRDWGLGIGNVEVSRNAFYGYDIGSEVLDSKRAVNIGGYQQTAVFYFNRQGAHHDVVPYLMERFGGTYRKQIAHFVSCLREGKATAAQLWLRNTVVPT